jgi:hypothetical protein
MFNAIQQSVETQTIVCVVAVGNTWAKTTLKIQLRDPLEHQICLPLNMLGARCMQFNFCS